MITIDLKGLLLNPQLHINVILPKLLNKIFILPVHKLIMKSILITLEIMHKKYMFNKFTISVNSMRENMVNNILIVITICLQNRHWSYMYINWMKYFFGWSHLNNSIFYYMHFWTWVKFLLTFHLLIWMIQVLIFVVYPMRNFYFLKHYHQKKHSQVSSEKKLSGCSPSFIYCNTTLYYHSYSQQREISSPSSS